MPRTVSVTPTSFTLNASISGTNKANQYVKFTNRTTGEYRTVKTNSAGNALVDAVDLSSDGTDSGTMSGCVIGDVVEVVVSGDGVKGTTITIDSSGGADASLSVTQASSSNCVGVTI